MKLIDKLNRKNIKVIEIPKGGASLRKQWEDNFANHMSVQEKKDIHLYDENGVCGYLWHLFSYGRRDSIKDEAAEQAFHAEQKNTCYVFYQHKEDALLIEDATVLTTNDLLNESDIYVVDKDFKWTYVKTHETGWCGPYFCRRE